MQSGGEIFVLSANGVVQPAAIDPAVADRNPPGGLQPQCTGQLGIAAQ